MNTVGSVCLAAHFTDQSPDYPTFSVLITSENRGQAAQDALRWLKGEIQTKQAAAVLDALELLDGDQVKPQRSRYAKHVIDLLSKKGQGQVLNRGEIIHDVNGVEYDKKFRLEPEWIVVVLGALIYSGDVTLSLPGKKFDASGIDLLSTTPINELVDFKHVERPKEWNIPALKALFEILGLAPGLAVQITQGDDGSVQQLQIELSKRVERIVMVQQQIQNGLPFWGRNLLETNEQTEYNQQLDTTKTFLESLQPYNSPGKLKNFRYDANEVQEHGKGLDALKEIEALNELVTDVGPQTAYLSTAEAVLTQEHPWVGSMREAREEVLSQVANPKKRSATGFRPELVRRLTQLKASYIDAYLAAHGKARLGVNEDKRKVELLKDKTLNQLQKLSTIDLMPRQQLMDFQERLAGLKTCYALTKPELDTAPTCPHCSFRPVSESVNIPVGVQLKRMGEELDTLHSEWTKSLLGNLEDPTIKSNFSLLKSDQKKSLEAFLKARELPTKLNDDFVKTLQEVLSGLQKVVVSGETLRTVLLSGGAPCTIQELKKRFDDYLTELAKGKDLARVRIVIE